MSLVTNYYIWVPVVIMQLLVIDNRQYALALNVCVVAQDAANGFLFGYE